MAAPTLRAYPKKRQRSSLRSPRTLVLEVRQCPHLSVTLLWSALLGPAREHDLLTRQRRSSRGRSPSSSRWRRARALEAAPKSDDLVQSAPTVNTRNRARGGVACSSRGGVPLVLPAEVLGLRPRRVLVGMRGRSCRT